MPQQIASDVRTSSNHIQASIIMAEITVDMEAIIKQAILSFVATVNEDGTPSLSPKASLTVRDGALYFADIASPRTILNLKRNPAVEINVIDVFQRTRVLGGVVELQTLQRRCASSGGKAS
jgi:predicted pyridoxine 5'-phosphate oxidase superfamily flavin-nucleotide-binding protein